MRRAAALRWEEGAGQGAAVVRRPSATAVRRRPRLYLASQRRADGTVVTFDTFGRMHKLTYPDGELLTNVYDSGGNLKSAAGEKRVDATGQNHRYRYLHGLYYDKFEQRVLMEQGNGVKTAYTYDAKTRRLARLAATRQGSNLFQNLDYAYDQVGNVLSLKNLTDLSQANTYGGPSFQRYEYDDLYRLTKAQGVFPYNQAGAAPDAGACATGPGIHCRVYTLDMAYDSIHNIQTKNQTDTRYPPGASAITQKKTTYNWSYQYNASGNTAVRPHAPTHIGERSYSYDQNGNQTGWTHDKNGTNRTIAWDEDNRIQTLADQGHTKYYKYDDQGQRIIKRGPQGETVYVNQFYTQRPGATGTKHVYAGTGRIASKLLRQDVPNANPQGNTPYEKDLYFYHPDHLGSSSYVTDLNAKLYEHLEYFPFGEGWIEENSNVQRTPYLFTAKELDEETGLYYFGARYYDPRTSVWQSADPILGKYLPNAPSKAEDIVKLLSPSVQQPLAQFNLPGMGGVYKPQNLNLYQYSFNNPVIYTDPDGKLAFYWHFIISFSESSKAGLGFWKSLAVAWQAMIYDARGTQGTTNPVDVNSHAMIAKDPMTGDVQTTEQAAAGADAFIAERLEQGTLRGLGEATHTGADKPAEGHKGKVWEGFSKAGFMGSVKHLLADFFPSKEVRQEARENVRATVEKWKEMHSKPTGAEE